MNHEAQPLEADLADESLAQTVEEAQIYNAGKRVVQHEVDPPKL